MSRGLSHGFFGAMEKGTASQNCRISPYTSVNHTPHRIAWSRSKPILAQYDMGSDGEQRHSGIQIARLDHGLQSLDHRIHRISQRATEGRQPKTMEPEADIDERHGFEKHLLKSDPQPDPRTGRIIKESGRVSKGGEEQEMGGVYRRH